MISLISKLRKRIKKIMLRQNQQTIGYNAEKYENLEGKSLVESYNALRHEAHRIEKAVYNDLLISKKPSFDNKVLKVKNIQKIIRRKDYNASTNPVYIWSEKIINAYPNLQQNFIDVNKGCPPQVNLKKGQQFVTDLENRRSCRILKGPLSNSLIEEIINLSYEALKWAPNSGNRQAVRMKPIIEEKEKRLLIGIKEKHCYTAPLLFFVGVDSRLYGALSDFEECMYLDASAAITQIILYLNSVGLGSSWNHFGLDLIKTRNENIKIYKKFQNKLDIPDYIIPIAIIAIGMPEYIPPKPARMPNEYFSI
ncbi:MAG: nitroreductase family protein [Bacteroidales bacterium]|nr:nitroreductase family protein [Bacteroidales bacterium]